MNNMRMASGFMRLVGAALFCFAALAGTAAAGVVPGPQGEYFNNMTLSGAPTLTRIDTSVNFNWGTGSPGAGVNADQFSVRWTGQVRIPANGAYTFYTQSDDGVRLWVDCNGNGSFQPGEQLVNNWTDHSSTENSGSCAGLSAGTWVNLRMEYYENGGDAVAQLRWSGPGIAKQIIPAYDGTRGIGYDDTTQPTIVSVTTSCGLAERVAVVFSEAVDPATATAISNYALNRGASVTGATLAPDGRTVMLQTSTLSSTGSYQLTVNNVRDLAVPPNTIAANTRVNFSYPGGGLRNGLTAPTTAKAAFPAPFSRAARWSVSMRWWISTGAAAVRRRASVRTISACAGRGMCRHRWRGSIRSARRATTASGCGWGVRRLSTTGRTTGRPTTRGR